MADAIIIKQPPIKTVKVVSPLHDDQTVVINEKDYHEDRKKSDEDETKVGYELVDPPKGIKRVRLKKGLKLDTDE